MSKPVFRVVATVEFILHSDFQNETEAVVVEAIKDALEDEHIGVTEGESANIVSIVIEPVES